jgi:CHAD domain-containing protein
MPLEGAARHVLEVRLRVVQDCLPRVLAGHERDPEPVHQLRVSTRRADAALRIFEDCLPGRRYKAARRRLRGIRRAAGAARDWDVFLLALRERQAAAPAEERPGLDFLVGYAHGQRVAAQAQLEVADLQADPGFDAFVREVLESVRAPHGAPAPATLAGLARAMLAKLSHDLEVAASADLRDYGNLHQVRIAGKRLRYAMEVFADCFGPAFRERLYPMVEELQEILGRANDSHVASVRLAGLRDRLKASCPAEWGRVRAGVEALLRSHQRRLPQERKRFLKWWQAWRGAGVEEVLAALQTAGSA